jgi:hypothetical protein
MARIKIRLSGIILLLLIIGILFAYGFGSTINTGFFDKSQNFFVGATLSISFIFVVIGFGLYLGYYL